MIRDKGLRQVGVKTATYAAGYFEVVPVNTAGGAVTVTLPLAYAGARVRVANVAASGTAAVTVAISGSDTLLGALTTLTPGAGAEYWCPSDGTWVRMAPVDSAAAMPSYSRPADLGYVTWSYDPRTASAGTVLTATSIYITRLRNNDGLSNANVTIDHAVTTAGAALTGVYVGLYRADTRVQLGTTSADQSTAFQTSGVKGVAFTGITLAAGIDLLVALVITGGTTMPTMSRGTLTGAMNGKRTTANALHALAGTGATLPGTLDPLSTTGAVSMFVGQS